VSKGRIFFMRAVITVVGKDTVGIIARVSTVLMENSVNILDISQTTMQDMFTMIMLVDTQKSEIDVKNLSERLEVVASELGLAIHVQNEELFNSMHRI
jgi:ACT domain-containing protein